MPNNCPKRCRFCWRSMSAGEGSKFGYNPEQMLAELEALNALPRLEIHGLMAIPPYTPVPEKARPYFSKPANSSNRLRRCSARHYRI